MRCIYDILPLSFSKVLAEINQHASDFNIESEILSALLIQPLISDNFNDAQQITDIRMDELRQACRENASDIMFPSVTDAWRFAGLTELLLTLSFVGQSISHFHTTV